jgi:hypothetical protein
MFGVCLELAWLLFGSCLAILLFYGTLVWLFYGTLVLLIVNLEVPNLKAGPREREKWGI